jgi:hypothetical protein
MDKVTPLLVNVSDPLTVPAALGVNTIGTVTLCVGFRVIGVVTPTLNPDPVIVSLVMFTEVVPVFVIFTGCVVVVFSACDPNPRLAGVAERLVELGVVGVGVGLGEVGELGELGELLAVFALPPQPIMLTSTTVKTRKRPAWLVVNILLRIVTPHLWGRQNPGGTSELTVIVRFRCSSITSSLRQFSLNK